MALALGHSDAFRGSISVPVGRKFAISSRWPVPYQLAHPQMRPWRRSCVCQVAGWRRLRLSDPRG